MKVFDNLYFVGTKSVATWIITTPEGYIVIDSGNPGEEQTTLLPGMLKLGLDPAKIKDVLITHSHSDHYGGAWYLQEHYGSHIYMSQLDWHFIEPKPGAKPAPGAGGALPKRDQVVADGEPGGAGRGTGNSSFHPRAHAGIHGFHLPGDRQREAAHGRTFLAERYSARRIGPWPAR